MRFDRITLSGYRCFEGTDVRFEPGVTVVHGVNGAGKSSLLEACFFALYGTGALRTGGSNLEDVISTNAEECRVELWFSHAGGEYRVCRELRRQGDRAAQSTAVLETPDGRIDGARAVDERIVSLFRMDADAFLNCAYVRQDEVNKLIEAVPAERRDTIDGLVQLGVLETYRDRASDARLGVKHVRDSLAGALADVTEQLEAKSESDLQRARERVSEQLAATDDRIAGLEGEREDAVDRREEARKTLAEREEIRADLETLREEAAEIETAVERDESTRADLAEKIDRLADAIEAAEAAARNALDAEAVTVASDAAPETVADALEAVEEGLESIGSEVETTELKAKQSRERGAELEEEAESLEEAADAREKQAADLEREIEAACEELADLDGAIDDLDDRIADARARFADATVAFGEADGFRDDLEAEREEVHGELTDVTSEHEAIQQTIERAERLREQGKCPTCGQAVEGSPHVDSLAEDRGRREELNEEREALGAELDTLDGRIEAAEALVEVESTVGLLEEKRQGRKEVRAERMATVGNRREQATTYREEADRKRTEAAEKRTAAGEAMATADEHDEAVAALREEREALTERRDALAAAIEAYETRGEYEDDRAELRQRREHLAELNEERCRQLEGKRSRIGELEESVDEDAVERARTRREEANARIEALEEGLDEANSKRDALQNQLGRIAGELDQLEELRERRAALARKVEALESLYGETEELQRMYGEIRADLRQRNIAALQRLVNEIFELAYRNDAYDRIELDGEYRATIYEKSGDALEPGKLSGGERVLFNLALRCGIYQLLVEGIDGTVPMPPLILDEPTAHLDAGHVGRIDDVVARMRETGVEQTIVVSHTEELIDAADHRIAVEQRPATNRSVAHVEADLLV